MVEKIFPGQVEVLENFTNGKMAQTINYSPLIICIGAPPEEFLKEEKEKERLSLKLIILYPPSSLAPLEDVAMYRGGFHIQVQIENFQWKTQFSLLLEHFKNRGLNVSQPLSFPFDREYLKGLSGSGPMLTVVLNKEGIVRYVSDNIPEILGYEPKSLLQSNVFELIHPEDYKGIVEVFKKGKTKPKHPQWLSLRIRHQDGSWRNFRSRGLNLFHDPKVEGILVTSVDITAQIEAETSLKKSEARYEFLSKVIHDGIWEWDIYQDKLFWSGKLREIIGPSADCEVESWKNLKPLIHPADRHHFEKALWSAVNETGALAIDIRILTQWGDYGYFNVRGGLVKDEKEHPIYMAGFVSDITLHKELLNKEKFFEYHDALTRLPNRAKLILQLRSSLISLRKDKKKKFTLVLLDLNRFKNINTIFGHKHGNQLLLSFSNRLKGLLDKSDVLARVAGSEFALLLRGKNVVEADALCRRIKSELCGPFSILGQQIYINISSGITECKGEVKEAETLIRNASIAMARAKQMGAHQSEVYSESVHRDEIYFRQLENDLPGALDKKQFSLEYQPIYSLSQDRVEGFEALIRWNHPKFGKLYPIDFIWLAEQSNLIIPMGNWVIEEACRQLGLWEKQFNQSLKVCVNLSPKQFIHTELFKSMERIFNEYPLEKNKLQFEITESVAMEDSEEHSLILEKLNNMGIQVSIDDFGVGYSSLEMLKNFELHTLKVDRSFIRDLSSNQKSAALVKAIISLARDLKLNIVAEGVETPEQLEFLRSIECDAIQGYFISQPLEVPKIESFLNRELAVFNP